MDCERRENSQIISFLLKLFPQNAQTYQNAPGHAPSPAPAPIRNPANLESQGTVFRENYNTASVPIPVHAAATAQIRNLSNLGSDGKKKRGRKRKNPSAVTNLDTAVVIYDGGRELVSRNGVPINVEALAKLEDPFGQELRRRTEGLRTVAELRNYLQGVEGQWNSTRMKKRIVDAGIFGDLLPREWKILISFKRREEHVWLHCRKYISPNGQQFESLKEVSSYLLSLFGPQDARRVSVRIVESTNQPTRSAAGVTRNDNTAKDDTICYSVAPLSSISPEHEKQLVLFSADDQSKTLHQNSIKCYKCKLNFGGKDAYFQHSLVCHRRRPRRPGLRKSICDGVIIRDGRYECQFCHKSYAEKRRYIGHIGTHVRYHGMGPESLADDITEQESNDQSPLDVMALTVCELGASVGLEKDKVDIPETSTATICNEPGTCSIHDNQDVKNTELQNSPKCSEVTQETISRKSVDVHEVTIGKLQDPPDSGNDVDVKMEPCVDTTTSVPTKEENTSVASNEKDIFLNAKPDEIDKMDNNLEPCPGNRSISEPDDEKTSDIGSHADDSSTHITKGTVLDETENSGVDQARGFESCSVVLPYTEDCYTDVCANENFSSNSKESVLDESEKSSYVPENGSGSDVVAMTEITARNDEENVLQNVMPDTSLVLLQQSGFSSVLDLDKSADKFSSSTQKLENLSGFDELSFVDIEPAKFGFVSGQDSGSITEAPMELAYEQGLDPSVQFEWDAVLPKMVGQHQLIAVCAWCSLEFNLDGVNPEVQSDSVGFICPSCKAKISGTLNLF